MIPASPSRWKARAAATVTALLGLGFAVPNLPAWADPTPAADTTSTSGSIGTTAPGGPVRAGTTRLPGSVPVLPNGTTVVGPTNGTTPITVDVALKPRDQSALDAFVKGVSTPGSSTFHQYLKAGEFESMFGPTASSITATRTWLGTTGLQVGETSGDGLLIPVTGTVGEVEQALGVALVDTQLPSGRVARANTESPTVPTSLAGSLQGVVGLSTVAQPQPQIALPGGGTPVPTTSGPSSVASPNAQQTNTSGPTACPAANAAASIFGAYTAGTIANAYGYNALYGQGRLGSGTTVGIFEEEPYLASDIQGYLTCYGIATSITNIPVDGGAGTGTQSGEAALDIEDVAGLAPASSILVYSGPNTSVGTFDIYDQMVHDDKAQVLSTSWGMCEGTATVGEISFEANILAEAAAQGQSFYAASGDSGSEGCTTPRKPDNSLIVDDPAGQPNITAVGGTSMTSAGTSPSEVVWNNGIGAGGGGVSIIFTQPLWQTGPGTSSTTSSCPVSSGPGTTSCREVPDVSASADPNHGYVMFFGGSWTAFGGTSAGSPSWSALTALTDQGCTTPMGLVNPTLYAAGSSATSPFNDITAGNNDWLGTNSGLYAATSNYDRASGWGTPKAASIIAALQPSGGCPSVTGVSPSVGPISGGQSVVISGNDLGTV
ncbi:MAG: hypothetical protein QOJ44_890, partial [Acidimicrobiaceae bacterium]|nr:hypothetical protein [Acidimicrobiaceae bacterium]